MHASSYHEVLVENQILSIKLCYCPTLLWVSYWKSFKALYLKIRYETNDSGLELCIPTLSTARTCSLLLYGVAQTLHCAQKFLKLFFFHWSLDNTVDIYIWCIVSLCSLCRQVQRDCISSMLYSLADPVGMDNVCRRTQPLLTEHIGRNALIRWANVPQHSNQSTLFTRLLLGLWSLSKLKSSTFNKPQN